MRNEMWTRGVVGLLVCTTLLAVAAATPFHTRSSVQTASEGRITKQQIALHSEPLLQALLTHAKNLDTVVSPVTTFNSAGQSVHHWNVDSSDATSGDLAHLLWNADTGELVRVSHFQQTVSCCKADAFSSQKEAVGLAWDWFHALKIGHSAEEWHVVGASKKPYAEWDIYFRAGDHYAIITVKTDTSQFVQALCGHLRNANMAWVPSKTQVPS